MANVALVADMLHGFPRPSLVQAPAGCATTFEAEARRWALKHTQEILGATVVARLIEAEPRT